MDESDWLAKRFEEHRDELRAVAYRMLGSLSEADDAVQEAWLRLSQADTSEVQNLFAAARGGDFEALVTVLDPDVVLRADGGLAGASVVLRGAEAVAGQAMMFAGPSRLVRPVLVNGGPGVVVTVAGRPVSVMGFTVTQDKIVAIDALSDPERLSQLDLAAVDDVVHIRQSGCRGS